jgi:hypothetical protein
MSRQYESVSSKDSKYVGYEPCRLGLVASKDATQEEVERAVRILRRVARRNGHPNLSLRQIANKFFIMSDQFAS